MSVPPVFGLINIILFVLLIILLVLLIMLSTKGIKALDLYTNDKNSSKTHQVHLSYDKVKSKNSQSDSDI